MHASPPRLSLGPVLYYWSRDELFAFYRDIASRPVDTVYLGETVCAKRRSLKLEDGLAIGEELAAAGKEVVLSSLALIEAESELKALRRLCDNGRFLVEANDMAAVQRLAGRSPFVAGPFINIYNHRTLHKLVSLGMRRWVMPVELSQAALARMQAKRPPKVETEIFAFGRLPLALSARCFTARAHRLPKDDCQFRCLDYPDGMLLSTQEEQRFLTLNGIQTQSAQTFTLLGVLAEVAELGVELLRISPQSRHTGRIVEIHAEVLRQGRPVDEALDELLRYLPHGPCDGYWHGRPGLHWSAQTAATSSRPQ